MRFKTQLRALAALLGLICGMHTPAAVAHDVVAYENVTAVKVTVKVPIAQIDPALPPELGLPSSPIDIGSRARTVLYLRPTVATTAGRPPAILLLEYLRGNAVDMAGLTDAARLVRDYGVWVILPESANGRWNYGLTSFSQADDVGFLTTVIDDAVNRFGVDPHRIYMGGYSNGAEMTQRYACDRSDKIAAGAIISGSIHVSDVRACKPTRPVPMIIFHGTADPQIKYDGNLLFTSSKATAELWAANADCNLAPLVYPQPDSADDGTTVTLNRYIGCRDNARVDQYVITGGGHTWPGALTFSQGLGRASQDVSATPLMWDFFKQFSRP